MEKREGREIGEKRPQREGSCLNVGIWRRDISTVLVRDS